ncbi:MAG: hypothetical protein ACFFCI_25135, partial [Promethearchaeota archaeon]
ALNPLVKTMADRAGKCVENARTLLIQQKDCQGAAFLLGIACHYIGDAVFYPHLDDLVMEHDGIVKGAIIKTTTRKLWDWYYKDGIISTENPFFTHQEAKTEFSLHKPKYSSGFTAVHYAGYDTWAGHSFSNYGGSDMIPGFQSTEHVNMPWIAERWWTMEMDQLRTVMHGDFGEWKEYRESYWDNYEESSKGRKYLEAISHHLNVGVYYTAAVINDVKDSFNGCIDKNPDDYKDKIQQAKDEVIGAYSFLWLFSWIGSFATFITITRTALGPTLSEMSSGYTQSFGIEAF